MKSPNAGMVLLISMFAISSALAQAGSSSQSNVLASGEVTKSIQLPEKSASDMVLSKA
jgi:hypothetical protein